MKGGKNKTHNRLWSARKRRQLARKQVARLLNHKAIDQISRYENGARIPTLRTALKLEIIYGQPLRLLFTDLYAQLGSEIYQRAETNAGIRSTLPHLTSEGQCSYADLIRSEDASREELQKVRDHVTELAKRLAYL